MQNVVKTVAKIHIQKHDCSFPKTFKTCGNIGKSVFLVMAKNTDSENTNTVPRKPSKTVGNIWKSAFLVVGRKTQIRKTRLQSPENL